jgi:hypothetical protein
MICSDVKSRRILDAYHVSNEQDRNRNDNARDGDASRERPREAENHTNSIDRPPHEGTSKPPRVKRQPTTPAHRNINGI